MRARRSLHKHAIPIGIKAVLLRYRVFVRLQHPFFPAERAHQHEQGGLRQVKIGKQRPDHSKFVSRIDENIRFAAACLDSPRPDCPAEYSNVRTVVVPTATTLRPASKARLIFSAASLEIT